MEKRPIGITVLAVLAALAAIAHLVGALQDFGVVPAVRTGSAGFFVSDPVGGTVQLLAMALAAALAAGLWARQDWARKAVVAIAAINIAVAFATQFDGGSGWVNALPAILFNAAVLLYARSSGVRQALDA
jgi:hypothetical protein